MKEIDINIEGYNVNGICVGCLNYKRKMFYVDEVKECFKVLADIDVPDGLSIQVCWECLAAVRTAMRFRDQISHAYSILIDYSAKNPFLNSPSDFTTYAVTHLSMSDTDIVTVYTDETKDEVEVKSEQEELHEAFDVKEEDIVKSEDESPEVDRQFNGFPEDNASSDDDVQLSKLKDEKLDKKKRGGKRKKKNEQQQSQQKSEPTKEHQNGAQIEQVTTDREEAKLNKNKKRKLRMSFKERRETRKARLILRNAGQSYVTKMGKLKPARCLTPLTDCRMKCISRITNEVREYIFSEYWSLGSYNKRAKVAERLIQIQERISNKVGMKRRDFSNTYKLIYLSEEFIVCRGCFLKTLGESSRFIQTVCEKIAKCGRRY